jgi:hypothetical protein
MTPQERLYAEEWPTGTFGHAQPPPEPPPRPIRPWSPEEQAQHHDELDEALSGWHWQDEPRVSRHLRLILNQPDTHAA